MTWTREVPRALTPITGTQPRPGHDLVPPGKGPAGAGAAAARPKSPAPSCRATPRSTSGPLVPTRSVPSGPIPRPPAWAPGSRIRLSIAHLSSRERGLHGLEPGSPKVSPTSSQPDCLVHLRRGIREFRCPRSPGPTSRKPRVPIRLPEPRQGQRLPGPTWPWGSQPHHMQLPSKSAHMDGGSSSPPWGFQPPLPAGHAPSGPGPGLSPGQSASQHTHCLLDFFRGCSSPGDQPRRGAQAWGSTLCLSIPRQLAGPRQGTGTAVRVCLPPSSQPFWPGSLPGAMTSPQPPAAGRGLPRPSMARLRLRVTPQPSQHSTRPWLGPTSKQRFHQPHAQMWRGLPTYAIPHLAVSSSFGGHTMKHTGSYPLTRDQTDTPCSSSATSWPLGRQGGPGSLVPEPCHLPPCSLGLPSHHASLCPSISFVRSHVCLVIHPRCGLL